MKKHTAFLMMLTVPMAGHGAAIDMDTPKTITAPKIEYDVKSETIQTSGKTEIVNTSGQRLTLTDSYLSKTGDSISGQDIELWLGHHVYVTAETIDRDGDRTVAHDAMFTACDGCDCFGNAWEITTSKFVHNSQTRMMQFYNPVFLAYGLPVMWFPFYEMPDPSVKYKSGLLMPDFESTNNMGTQFNLPIYLSFSDMHDMTLRLSYLTQENPLFHAEHRLNTRHGQFRTTGSFTHNRDGENRWHIFNDDVIELGEYARATVYLERASDKTYLQKYGFYGEQPYLDSGARVELFGQSSYAVADMHVFQELRSTSHFYSTPSGDILPNIRGVYQTAPFFHETYATFSGDILGISGSETSNQRMIGMVSVTSPWTLPWGNRLTANVGARYDLYNFSNTEMVGGENFSGVKARFLPSGYVEWGLPLLKTGTTWSQVIEPRARLTMMQHTDDAQFALNTDSAGTFLSDTTLFSDNRFAGLDVWENGTFADYGVRWAAFGDNNQNVEIFLGQSYDFTDNFADEMATDLNSGFHDGLSDYVGRVAYNNGGWLDVAARFRFAQTDMNLRHMETSAHIGTSKNFINIGHIYSAQFIDAQTMGNDIHEAVIGAGIQLTERWGLRWNGIYNLTDEHFQRHSGGVFYTHPCYYFSVEYRRDNAIKDDYVGTTTFQFRFGMSIDGQKY